ncbi:NifU N-terminal domain-containing protein [Oceanobacillus jeddahense]|uniref:NifU N-terminal domain-containing protein n=1 Tax=Oceanobacillus jeddahense TaxID=1462527 RepID=A0ABY5JNE6_9BACI|nr:NifU N-terminal domain-containing protein [Oceanobacillus jeddahense]UUI01814.1 NifU N-terminal domain-containing protein [Oceanobacillus jeddahense]
MAVHISPTPNPNAMKYTSDSVIFSGTNSISVMPGDVSEHEILNELMKLEDVDNVFGYQNFITVNKHFDADWESINPKVEEIFVKFGY